MRDLPYLVIAAFLLLWGIVTAARAPVGVQADSVAEPLSFDQDEDGDLPPDIAEMPEVAPEGFPWPDYLVYPNWTVGNLQTSSGHTECSSSDSFDIVQQWYWQRLPQSVLVEYAPREHVSVVNEDIEIELRRTPGGGTSIEIKARPQQ